MKTDRHDNKNWSFAKSKPDPILPGKFIRLYRSTSNPSLYKRVANRCGTTSHEWQCVSYALSTVRNADNSLVWVRSVELAMDTPRTQGWHNWVAKYNSGTDADREEMDTQRPGWQTAMRNGEDF